MLCNTAFIRIIYFRLHHFSFIRYRNCDIPSCFGFSALAPHGTALSLSFGLNRIFLQMHNYRLVNPTLSCSTLQDIEIHHLVFSYKHDLTPPHRSRTAAVLIPRGRHTTVFTLPIFRYRVHSSTIRITHTLSLQRSRDPEVICALNLFYAPRSCDLSHSQASALRASSRRTFLCSRTAVFPRCLLFPPLTSWMKTTLCTSYLLLLQPFCQIICMIHVALIVHVFASIAMVLQPSNLLYNQCTIILYLKIV